MGDAKQDDAAHEKWLGWQGDYDGTECPNCRRLRMLKCANGRRRCEKCNWDPEAGTYADYDNR